MRTSVLPLPPGPQTRPNAGADVCPLCMRSYASEAECTCSVCESHSCPGCVERVGKALRCFACAPGTPIDIRAAS